MKQVNLLPWREQQTRQKKITFLLVASGSVVVSCLLLGGLRGLISYQVQKMDFHKNQLVEQVNSISLAIEKLQKIKQHLHQLQTTTHLLSIQRQQIRKILAILRDLKIEAPRGFFIKTVTYDAPHLSLVGTVVSESIFLESIKKLEIKYTIRFKWHCQKKNSYFEFGMNSDLY
jgi:Tfp pilus assembly protein PilN